MTAEQINAMGGLAETGRHDLNKLARCHRIVPRSPSQRFDR